MVVLMSCFLERPSWAGLGCFEVLGKNFGVFFFYLSSRHSRRVRFLLSFSWASA